MAAFSLRVVEETWEPSLVNRITLPESPNVPHSLPLHGTRFARWSIWSDPSEATGQSWQIHQLFLHRSCVTQESCGTEMTHYTKKHVVDYTVKNRV